MLATRARVATTLVLRRTLTPHLRIATPSIRHCSDKAREAALHAIANAQRSAGELAAAEAAADAAEAPKDGAPTASSTPQVPPRFPLGATVECRLGPDRWEKGTVVGIHYREPSWPADRPRAPYQVRLDGTIAGKKAPLIYAPEDVDECVRSTLRFELGSSVECFIGGDDGWVAGEVVARYHREPSWPPTQWAPYQVLLADGPHGLGANAKVYAPEDTDSCIREPAALEWPWPGAKRS